MFRSCNLFLSVSSLFQTPSTMLLCCCETCCKTCCSCVLADVKAALPFVAWPLPLTAVNPPPSRGPIVGLSPDSGGVSIALDDIGLPRDAVSPSCKTELGASATKDAGVPPSCCPENSASARACRFSAFFRLSRSRRSRARMTLHAFSPIHQWRSL